jgi:oxygen-independent coproporphyrinogen-3 oxidase
VFSLYVHIPYCERKCPYCDFNSHGGTSWPEARYTAALTRELAHYAARPPWAGDAIATVFLGGGTPSLFAPASIGRILDAAAGAFGLAADAEITLEANPGTVSLETLQGFRRAGVTRLSFGIQSLHDRHLATLGRIHSAAAAVTAVELARRAGFEAINTDFIFGVPGQTVAEWDADLQAALALDPGHISAYNLTYEEGTAFHAWRAAGRLVPAREEDELEMFRLARARLGAAGYEAYEISNHARPGRACRHNLTYWRRQPYLGIGAGAHSFAAVPGHGRRWSNERQPDRYIARCEARDEARVAVEECTRPQAMGEFMFLGLRLARGIAVDEFARAFGTGPEQAYPALQRFAAEGYLEQTGSRLRLTATGLLMADSVFATFV